MRQTYTDIMINATPEQVWDVATNFESFPDWNPFLKRVDGDLKPGSTLDVEADTGGKVERMRATVLTSDRPREMRWNIRKARGLFNTEYVLAIRPTRDESVRLIQQCTFTGLLTPMMSGVIDGMTKGCDAMGEAVRSQVEGAAGGNGSTPAAAESSEPEDE